MTLPKLRSKIQFQKLLLEKGELGLTDVNVDIPNPLRSKHSINWFKNHAKNNANRDYVDTVHNKLIVHELGRLFESFCGEKDAKFDLDKMHLLFEAAGLIIDCQLLKKIFI
jgi:hypothetical protein